MSYINIRTGVFMLRGLFICKRAKDFQVSTAASFLFFIIVVNANSEGTILAFCHYSVSHERFLHDFNVNWVSMMKHVAFIIRSRHKLRQLIVKDLNLSFSFR